LAAARDREVWNHAATTRAALITKDEDFVTMRALRRDGPAVIWIRIGNTTRREIIARFDAVFAGVVAALERGETIIQVPEA
jgi:predicted nuclease of predicted toxin-antitoxin system